MNGYHTRGSLRGRNDLLTAALHGTDRQALSAWAKKRQREEAERENRRRDASATVFAISAVIIGVFLIAQFVGQVIA